MSIRTPSAGGREPGSKRSRRIVAIAAVLLAVAGIAALVAYLQSRDDASLQSVQGAGVRRAPGERPRVRPGNVLLLYAKDGQAPRLRALGRELGGSGAALAKAGQAVLVRRDRSIRAPIVALSAHHRQDASTASDPAVRGFVEYWLGRAPG